jgi:hypothetical protein
MHVVRHNLKLIKLHAVTLSSFTQNCFTKPPHPRELKTIPTILRLPHQVKTVLPNCVGKNVCFHFFASGKKELTLTQLVDEWRNSVRHSFPFKDYKKKLCSVSLKAEATLKPISI